MNNMGVKNSVEKMVTEDHGLLYGDACETMKAVVACPEAYSWEMIKERLLKGDVSYEMAIILNDWQTQYDDIYTRSIAIGGPVELCILTEMWDEAAEYLKKGYGLSDYIVSATSYIPSLDIPERERFGKAVYNGNWTYKKSGIELVLNRNDISDRCFRNIIRNTDRDLSIRDADFPDAELYLTGIERCKKLMGKEWSDKHITEKVLDSLLCAYWFSHINHLPADDPELGEWPKNEKEDVIEQAEEKRRAFIGEIRKLKIITGDPEVFTEAWIDMVGPKLELYEGTLAEWKKMLSFGLEMWLEVLSEKRI